MLNEAGLGEGVVNVITHAPEDAPAIVERLIANPAVKRTNFTGSTRVGRIVAELSARHLKPALLELGGKAPVLVLDDADLDAAVEGIAFGAFFNQGQICMICSLGLHRVRPNCTHSVYTAVVDPTTSLELQRILLSPAMGASFWLPAKCILGVRRRHTALPVQSKRVGPGARMELNARSI